MECCSNDITVKYAEGFDKNLGTLPGKIHLQVDPDCKSVIFLARKLFMFVHEKFKGGLLRLPLLMNQLNGSVRLW